MVAGRVGTIKLRLSLATVVYIAINRMHWIARAEAQTP